MTPARWSPVLLLLVALCLTASAAVAQIVRPTTRVTTTPASRPATEPNSPPATEKGAWADAKVGTMVKSKLRGDMTRTQEVVKADEKTVTLKTTVSVKDVKPSDVEMPRLFTVDQLQKAMEAMGRRTGADTLKIAGTVAPCDIYEKDMKFGDRAVKTKTWVCKDVPGWVVRIDSDATGKMETISEVVEFKK